jgi:NADPH-dependent curcumin reductase CurA
VHGRAALCGSISGYNAVEPPPGPRNLGLMVGKRLTLRGFLVSDHADLRPEFTETVTGWLRSGDLVVRRPSTRASSRRCRPSSHCYVAATPGSWSSVWRRPD